MKEKNIDFGGRTITVKELTVRQVDGLFENATADRKATTAELLINSSIPIDAVIASSGLTVEELGGDVLPSELERLWSAVAEVNDFLSRMCERLGAVAKMMQPPASSEMSAG